MDPEKLIGDWLDGSLNPDQQAALEAWLKAEDEHLRHFTDTVIFDQQVRSAVAAAHQQNAVSSFGLPDGASLLSRGTAIAIAASLIAMLTLAFWPRTVNDVTFATLAQTRAALWESGDLPTADGSRLGRGALRLAEGLATVRFDSGAEVVLEAPATLMLGDAMNCRLVRGTAVSDIPDSALGFRIKTPSADVVDYGTRFAVSVYEANGETHTQVMEGRVQVEYNGSGEVVELRTGQQNSVIGEVLGSATDGAKQEYRTTPFPPIDHGPEWTLIETTKDAYTGRVKGHESDVLLYVKHGVDDDSPHRTAYLGFDLRKINREEMTDAELLLYFEPTGWGLASLVPDATFSVYGMVGDSPEWDESILYGQFPGDPEWTHLGSFTMDQGIQKGRFRVQTEALKTFLREHAPSNITLMVVRDTRETENSGLVHGFASRRHVVLPPPTLAIRHASTAEGED